MEANFHLVEAAVKIEAAHIETSYINALAFNMYVGYEFLPLYRAKIKPLIVNFKVRDNRG